MVKKFLLSFSLVLSLLVYAQPSKAQSLYVPKEFEAAYAKGTRSTDGKPGKNYWQNTADYKINVNFDPQSLLVTGEVEIAYLNYSPDTLKQIWFKLYPNYYQAGAPRDGRVELQDVTEGVSIDSMWVNGKWVDKRQYSINATNMMLRGHQVSPGGNLPVRIKYHYTLNKTSHRRTGEVEPNAAFVAYFFPRIAVYDDIDGWNRTPYLGSLEFYNDFCNFDVHITVPNRFLVWATGDLQNATDMLQPKYHQSLQQAERSDDVVTIIDTTDLKDQITANHPFNTWHYKAKNVTDFVFATSDHYIWKSTSLVVDPATGRRTRADAVFNPVHKDYFHVVHDARKTVESMSYRFPAWPFPYPHITVFDGLDQMEYPMMVNDNPVEDRAESIELTDHEIFHTMFPFYMGINETKYAWMDEGWATIGEWLISPMIDSSIVDEYGVAPYEMTAGNQVDLPVTTLSTQTNGTTYFLNAYAKPAFGYLYVKDMLGDSLFTKALHHYIEQWHGKHPTPYDFFYAMNEGAGRNMNWFWKRWFFDNGIPDLGIASVKKKGKNYVVGITSVGNKPVPVDLELTYADGSRTTVHRSVAVWENCDKTITISVPANKKLVKAALTGIYNVDSNKADNVFEVK